MNKNFIAILLTTAFLGCSVTPTYVQAQDTYIQTQDIISNLSEYEQYKVKNTSKTGEISIDNAIAFVESLDLEKEGYASIKEACLAELKQYKEDNIELTSYTVLVPKSRASDTYFGTKGGYDFYSRYTSISDFRINERGSKKSRSNESSWASWMKGGVDLAMCFANFKWGIPYAGISALVGNLQPADIHYGSYNEYVGQFTNVVTRSIYAMKNNYEKITYQDQTGTLRITHYFCPVGTVFNSDYIKVGSKSGSVRIPETRNNSNILQTAYGNLVRDGKTVWKLSYLSISERWE